MKLGSAIRRRQIKRRLDIPGWRGALSGMILLLVGLGMGYGFSTKIWFPILEEEGVFLEVTSVRNIDSKKAIEDIASLGLYGLVVDSLRHPTAVSGQVLGQHPLPGQLSFPGDTVELTVSLGPIRRAVPDVTRISLEAALLLLESSGFAVVSTDSLEAELPLGQVVEVLPEPGTEVDLPMEVRVAVSRGPSLIAMPLLLGVEQKEGEEVLDSLGLIVGEITSRFRFGRDQGRIVEQKPRADSLVAPGSSVSIVVGRRSSGSRN
ncbi:MAG: PASTA domain-containing protein [Longimicrobiales bacterium]|nr:PASTA domain-containing protein [Longimicrobiales bacterium]